MRSAKKADDPAHSGDPQTNQSHQSNRVLWLKCAPKACYETTDTIKPRVFTISMLAVLMASAIAATAQIAQPVIISGWNLPFGNSLPVTVVGSRTLPVNVSNPIQVAKDSPQTNFDIARSRSNQLLREKKFDLDLGLDQEVPGGKLGSTVHVLSGAAVSAFACSLRYSRGDFVADAFLDFDELETLLSTQPVVTTFKPDPAATSDSLSFTSRNGQLSLQVSGTNLGLTLRGGYPHSFNTPLSDSPKVYAAIRKARDKLVELGAKK